MRNIFKQKSAKFALFIIAFLILILSIGYCVFFMNINSRTLDLAKSNNITKDLTNWAELFNTIKIFPDSPNNSFADNLIMNKLDSYIKNVNNFNKTNLVKLPLIEILEYKENDAIINQTGSYTDNTFFINENYNGNIGPLTFLRNLNFKLKIDDQIPRPVNILLYTKETTQYLGKITGTLGENDTIEMIKISFNELLNNLMAKDEQKSCEFISNENPPSVVKQITALNNLDNKLLGLKYSGFERSITDNDENVLVGEIIYEQKNSGLKIKLAVAYDKSNKKYKFIDPFDSFSLIPEPKLIVTPTPPNNTTQTLNCTDCFLAAIDKTHSLPSSYIPQVQNVNLLGGGQLTSATISALTNLFNDASSKGITIKIISTYRSYQTQVTTFNYWVSRQKATGLDQYNAEIAANKISAHAGQSEHQLGTTVDLKCSTCGDFDLSANSRNWDLFHYIENNAHKFGFVLSYPKNKENLTGYSYEPWHIRYIGVNLATEFFNRGYLSNPNDWSTKYLQQL